MHLTAVVPPRTWKQLISMAAASTWAAAHSAFLEQEGSTRRMTVGLKSWFEHTVRPEAAADAADQKIGETARQINLSLFYPFLASGATSS